MRPGRRIAGRIAGRIGGRIGIIGGAGWLGGAIGRALIGAGVVAPGDLWVSARSERRGAYAAWPEVTVTTDNDALCAACDTVLVSLPPAAFPALRVAPRDRLVVSVMAGVRAGDIAAATGSGRVVRALPNAAAEIARSFTPWWAAAEVTGPDREVVGAIFRACGAEAEIAAEDQIDYFTALTGSGPAFPALLAAAMAEHAVAQGIDPGLADRAVRHLLAGGAELLMSQAATPEESVRAFTDYAGTTAAGLTAMQAPGMQAAGLRSAVARGLEAATARARALAAPED